MYCKHCGKELADEALMCPDCGTPTDGKRAAQKPALVNEQPSPRGTVALFLAIFAFVTGIIFGSFFYVFTGSAILLYMIGATTILPALTAVCLGITVLIRGEAGKERAIAIVAIALAGTVLLFLFLSVCIIASGVL